jgi:phage portal protein BeeE
MVAEAAASTPLVVFVDGTRRDDHPLALLLAQPNPEQSGTE